MMSILLTGSLVRDCKFAGIVIFLQHESTIYEQFTVPLCLIFGFLQFSELFSEANKT